MSTSPAQPDFYELLGLTRSATRDEVKRAFRDVSKRTHPDAGGNPGLFRLVTEAYETLVDPSRRREYDAGVDARRAEAERLSQLEAALAARTAEVESLRRSSVQPVMNPSSQPVQVTSQAKPSLSDHWRGWAGFTAAAALGPLFWVGLWWSGVFSSFPVRSPQLVDALEWFTAGGLHLPALLAVCAAAGYVFFRFSLFLAVADLEPPLRRGLFSTYLVFGALLPCLPSVPAFLALSFASLIPFLGSLLWRYFRSRR